jgi:hypothetical protein
MTVPQCDPSTFQTTLSCLSYSMPSTACMMAFPFEATIPPTWLQAFSPTAPSCGTFTPCDAPVLQAAGGDSIPASHVTARDAVPAPQAPKASTVSAPASPVSLDNGIVPLNVKREVDALTPAETLDACAPNRIKFLCSYCAASFRHIALKTQHVMQAHQNNPVLRATPLCGTCGKTFSTDAELSTHEREHYTFACEHCDFCTMSKAALLEHSKKHKDRSWSCKFCSQTFVTRAGKLSHERSHKREAGMTGLEACGKPSETCVVTQARTLEPPPSKIDLPLPSPHLECQVSIGLSRDCQ